MVRTLTTRNKWGRVNLVDLNYDSDRLYFQIPIRKKNTTGEDSEYGCPDFCFPAERKLNESMPLGRVSFFGKNRQPTDAVHAGSTE